MTPSELHNIFNNIDTTELLGNDCSPANIFLYQEQYKISTLVKDDVFYRFYGDFSDTNKKIGFPLPYKTCQSNYLRDALLYLTESFKEVEFCFCTEKQTQQLNEIISQFFPQYSIQWECNRERSDYLYLQENLANLHGQIYQKKKNHVLHFLKTYDNKWNFSFFTSQNITNKQKEDILQIEEKWFIKKNGDTESNLIEEKRIIKNAIDNFENFNLIGGIIYIQNTPVAMTLASPISPSVLDIHFEKSLNEPAKNGAYAAINNFFAKECKNFQYLNREEDLGIPGLRKAKLSYKPQIILDKYSGKLQKSL